MYFFTFSQDPNLVSDWQPMCNLRNAKVLIEDFRKRIQTQVENKNSLIFNSNQVKIILCLKFYTNETH